MRNGKVKHFLTTREVSTYLGVSTGTVQKMVDKKVFESYLTSGGHRRIATESLKKYMSGMNADVASLLHPNQHSQAGKSKSQVSLLLGRNSVFFNRDLSEFSEMEFIKEPADLFMLFGRDGVLIVDAAVDWVNWIDGILRLHALKPHFELIVFNAQCLSEKQKNILFSIAELFDGEPALDYIRGYLALPLKSVRANRLYA